MTTTINILVGGDDEEACTYLTRILGYRYYGPRRVYAY
jgi:hypothetical protein